MVYIKTKRGIVREFVKIRKGYIKKEALKIFKASLLLLFFMLS